MTRTFSNPARSGAVQAALNRVDYGNILIDNCGNCRYRSKEGVCWNPNSPHYQDVTPDFWFCEYWLQRILVVIFT